MSGKKSNAPKKPSPPKDKNKKSFRNLFKKVSTPSSQFEDFASDDEGCPAVHNASSLGGGPLALRGGVTLKRIRQRKFTSGVKLGLAIQGVGVKARRGCDYCQSGKGPFAACRAWQPLGSKCGNCSYDNQICSSGWFVNLLVDKTGRSRRKVEAHRAAKLKPQPSTEDDEDEEDEEDEEEDEGEYEGEDFGEMDLDDDEPEGGIGGGSSRPFGGAGGAGFEVVV